MSVAFFIVTEREPLDLETFVNGKAIAKVDEKLLDKLCTAAGVRSIYDFVSMDTEELADFLDDEEVDEVNELPSEQWFSAEEGLEWTTKLANYLKANPTALKGSEDALSDLSEYALVFHGLEKQGIRWHFQVDF